MAPGAAQDASPARYKKYRSAANKLAAHLTFDRIKYERRRFPTRPSFDRVLSATSHCSPLA